ncbi:hypothetical protein GGR56DRAFT_684509 [Xylariaceae sp. FL0804]|nr:hypothetical protein GGR56DRAFT_684509 [Xylariaceae sp. FL0804]
MSAAAATLPEDGSPLVEPIESEEDMAEAFRCLCNAFGRQTGDAIFTGLNPGWDTPAGEAAGAARMLRRLRAAGVDRDGRPTTMFLKATVAADDADGRRRAAVAGMAVWVQASCAPGRGHDPTAGDGLAGELAELYPGDEREQRYMRQVFESLVRQRVEFVRALADDNKQQLQHHDDGDGDDDDAPSYPCPAVMVLDICACDPAYQRRGAATALVRWGLDEARRRGIRDATTEGSSMGRHVYRRLGFVDRPPDIVFDVDDEFKERPRPANVFMHARLDS